MTELKTRPGVYIEEVTKLPPSVAQVETAIPAFIGYTQSGPTYEPIKIKSLLEYETIFGKANPEKIILEDTVNEGLKLVQPKATFLMYYSLQMYFANGGGPCYIVSVENYSSEVKKDHLIGGLNILAEEDEPTLIVFPDAISLTEQTEFYQIYQNAINQATQLKDRFVIMDTYFGNSTTTTPVDMNNYNTIEYFRKGVDSTSYGATYFPHLKTVLNYTFDEATPIEHSGIQSDQELAQNISPFQEEIDALISLQGDASNEILNGIDANPVLLADLLAQAIAIVEKVNETADTEIDLTEANAVLDAINNGTITDFTTDQTTGPAGSFIEEFQQLRDALEAAIDLDGHAEGITLNDLKATNSVLYNQIKNKIASSQVVLPPSSTIAGIYAKVDSTRGVWKAPANVALNYVVIPTEKVSDEEQKGLNVDPDNSGKSINVIRNFTRKGNLVWGARTFKSDEHDWQYIQVRRFFNMVEESLRNATKKFEGESNDAVTWLRAKTMVENFLNQQWMYGALLGSTPKEAFSVKVGNPETMNDTDVEEGRMNIVIEMAIVRPAEFITLNFSCKL